MGMIRVSDHAEKIIRENTNGRTITATVDAMIAGGPREKESGVSKEYLDERFDTLESMIRRAAGEY